MKKLRVDKQVLEAHDAATKALKSCREAHGLSVEKVEDVMDALAEVRISQPTGCLRPTSDARCTMHEAR